MFRKNGTKKSFAKRAAAAVMCALMCVGILAAAPEKAAACDTYSSAEYDTYYAAVESGYLALRNAPSYNSSNEIARIVNNEMILVAKSAQCNAEYWYVYVPDLDMWGYANSGYMIREGSDAWYTVNVSSGYLALRDDRYYNTSCEIGRLNNGDSVQVMARGNNTYWYVYSPTLNLYGYVNKNYINIRRNTGATVSAPAGRTYYTARVESGYLALRNGQSYDRSNEIGCIYTGEQVEVITKGSGTYWYVYVPSLGMYGYTNKNYLY